MSQSMRDPVPVFMCLARLRAFAPKAFDWVYDSLLLDFNKKDETQLMSVADTLGADIIRYDNLVVLRVNPIDITVFDTTSEVPVDAELSLITLLNRQYPKNPLRA